MKISANSRCFIVVDHVYLSYDVHIWLYCKLGNNNNNSSYYSVSVGLEKLCLTLFLKQKSMAAISAAFGVMRHLEMIQNTRQLWLNIRYSALYGILSNQKVYYLYELLEPSLLGYHIK